MDPKVLEAACSEAYNIVNERLKAWVVNLPDSEKEKPMLGVAGPDVLSPRDMVRHVEDRTPQGDQIVADWVLVAVRKAMDSH